MKRRRLLPLLPGFLFIFLMIPRGGYAVPAAPGLHILTQPDGTSFMARQWGDEWSHGWETEEGFSLVQDRASRQWRYAELTPEGYLSHSRMVVGKDAHPMVKKKLRPMAKAREAMQQMRSDAFAPEAPIAPFGISSQNVLAIMVDFNDEAHVDWPLSFQDLFFSASSDSVAKYYTEVSYGNFSVLPASETYGTGNDGVVGWVRLNQNHPDCENAANSSACYQSLARSAIQAADPYVNFADFDMNANGSVSGDELAIILVIAGYEYAYSNTSPGVWAHQWSVLPPLSLDGKAISQYAMFGERHGSHQATIGVMAHEFGHLMLALPDLYDTDGSSEGIGDWSLMAGGSWNSVSTAGDRPAHLDAWCKYYLGWVAPTEVSGTLTNEPITQSATSPDIYKLLSGGPLSGEYFLIENRQQIGFDAGLPGSGLLLWHIDGNAIAAKIFSNSVNNYECYPGGPDCGTDHYGVKLVQADNVWQMEKNLNRGNPGDAYKAGGNITFNGSSSPNSNLYNGSASNASITAVSATGATMTATLSNIQAADSIRRVCPTGCAQYIHIQDAIDASGSGDIIKLAQGVYHENILIDTVKDVTIIGGYDASFSEPPAHDPSLTVLDGDSAQPYDGVGDGSVLSMTAGSSIILENLTIRNGYAATGQGGGISVASAAGPVVLDLRSTVIRNNAAETGGGMYASSMDASQNVTVTAQNSFIVENAAERGGGIFLGSEGTGTTTLSLLNSTVAENRVRTAGSGAGIYAGQTGSSATTDLTVVNSIIWGNRAKDTLAGDDIGKAAAAAVTAFYSDIGSGDFSAGAGVMNEDPVFINPAFYNYRVNADSPAVNQGTPAEAPAIDFEGQSRDASPDIGADEFVAAVPATVKLLSLNGGEIIPAGKPYDITWEAPPTARSFKVLCSFDNGITWRKPKSADPAVTGNIVNDQKHFRWDVPVLFKNKKRCMIKVVGFSGLNGAGTKVSGDRSDLPFAISVARIIAPNGETPVKANAATAVRWVTTENPQSAVAGVKLSYTTNGGLTWKPMILQDPLAGDPGEAVWITPALFRKKTKCKIKITLYDAGNVKVGSGSGNGFFVMEP